MEHAKSHARAVIGTWSDMVIGAVGSVRGFALATGDNSWACGSGSLASELSVSNVAAALLALCWQGNFQH